MQLARADYIHALGSLATLLITIFLTGLVLFFSLRALSDQALRVAALLALRGLRGADHGRHVDAFDGGRHVDVLILVLVRGRRRGLGGGVEAERPR